VAGTRKRVPNGGTKHFKGSVPKNRKTDFAGAAGEKGKNSTQLKKKKEKKVEDAQSNVQGDAHDEKTVGKPIWGGEENRDVLSGLKKPD